MTKSPSEQTDEEKETIINRVKKDLRFFVSAMLYKLKKNVHKGRYEQDGTSVEQALIRLKEEVAELEEAIAEGNDIEIIMEAADVANFAMIAAVKATERATARDS